MNDDVKGQHGWVYLCSSMDAFDAPGKAYMGPLNGHVNGGIVMKEIHKYVTFDTSTKSLLTECQAVDALAGRWSRHDRDAEA